MITKILEIRDEGTFIPCLAIKMIPANQDQEYYLHDRCGYPQDFTSIMVTNLNGERHASADPYFWVDRTWNVAHNYITENFDDLKDGDVVDVSFILGETKECKVSERFTVRY